MGTQSENGELLTPSEIKALDSRLSENAKRLIERVKPKKDIEIKEKDTRGRKGSSIENKLFDYLIGVDAEEDRWPLWIDDVLQGVARLDWYRTDAPSKPLSTGKILRIFKGLQLINTNNIQILLGLEERQARRYLKACKLCYPYLLKGLNDKSIKTLRYPYYVPELGIVPVTKD